MQRTTVSPAARIEIILTQGSSPRLVIAVTDSRLEARKAVKSLGGTARAVDLGTGEVFDPKVDRWIKPDTAAVIDGKTPTRGEAFSALMWDLGVDLMRAQARSWGIQ